MTDDLTIAVAHYPEGAGHATRMLAIADELADSGAKVELAGGGAGTQFVALNGYDEFEPTTVDYIDTYQGGSLRRVLRESVPATAERVTDYVGWLRELDPDALVTDDMFAAIAATRTDVPLYVLKHDLPGLYRDRIERTGAAFHTEFQRSAAREFFYPAVWPPAEGEPVATETEDEDEDENESADEDDDSADVTRVPPVALEGDEDERPSTESAPDVVVVPSHYSDLGRVADNLARQGYDVLDVGSEEWEPVASLLPHLRAADVVVCSGYSTVMDAAVAGTPCVVHPATDEQEAVANRLEDADVTGFAVAETPIDVLDAVASPPEAPSFENGAADVADAVLDDLRNDVGPASGTDGAMASSGMDSGGSTGDGATGEGATLTDRAVASGAALGTAARATALRTRRYAGVVREYASTGAVLAYRHARRAGRSTARYATVAAVTLADWTRRTARWTRTTAHRCRRYATAVTALSAATLVVTNSGLRGTGDRLAGGSVAAMSTLRNAISTGLEHAAAGCERLADGLQRAAAGCRAGADALGSPTDRLGSLGRRLKEATRSAE